MISISITLIPRRLGTSDCWSRSDGGPKHKSGLSVESNLKLARETQMSVLEAYDSRT
jgi:hypothetical protein